MCAAIMATKIPDAPKIGMVSLGCPKNLVDSERILTKLRSDGYQMSADYAGADVVLVNTCGFLDSAKEESLEAIGEAMAENGRVIVTGCMGDEADVIRAKFPQVLAVTGAHQYEQVVNAVHDASPPIPNAFVDLVPEGGLKLTPRHYSYLKISEGCNHRCSFCIIPSIRGDLVSRRIDAVLREAEKLVAAGTKELLVISQDTSAYGVDTRHDPRMWKGREVRAHMTDMARELGQLRTAEGKAPWVRLHYVYPYPHVDQVIPLMADGLLTPYLDIPFQHASPSVLKAMKRPANEAKVLSRIASGATSARTSRFVPASWSASPVRRRRISNICSTGWTRRNWTASAPSASNRSRGLQLMTCRAPCPKRSRKNAISGSWKRPPRSAPPNCRRRSVASCPSSSMKWANRTRTMAASAPPRDRKPTRRKSTAMSSCAMWAKGAKPATCSMC